MTLNQRAQDTRDAFSRAHVAAKVGDGRGGPRTTADSPDEEESEETP